MKNEIACTGIPGESEFQVLQVISRNASASGLYNGVGSEQKIFMVLLAARELGIPPLQALNGGLWNIQGKIEISARLMSSMIRRAGHSMNIKHSDSQKCVIEGKRADNGDTFCAQFTIEEAQKAGLAGRGPWKTYAEDMLYARAMSRLARRLFSDVIGTSYVEGEIRDSKPSPIQEVILEEIVETEEDKESSILDFLRNWPEEDHLSMNSYIRKYANHWKKSIQQSLIDYSDQDKFSKDFYRWKEQQKPKVTLAA